MINVGCYLVEEYQNLLKLCKVVTLNPKINNM